MAKWKDTYGGAKMEGDDSIHTLTCNVIPGKRVPVCDLLILKGCSLALFVTRMGCVNFTLLSVSCQSAVVSY